MRCAKRKRENFRERERERKRKTERERGVCLLEMHMCVSLKELISREKRR